HMGNCAEACAAKYSFTREQQDAFATESFKRAIAAQQEGRAADEIIPVEVSDAKGNATVVERDEGPGRVRFDKMAALKPSFQKDGTITPANASSLSDGAAALVLTTAATADARGLKPVARVVAF